MYIHLNSYTKSHYIQVAISQGTGLSSATTSLGDHSVTIALRVAYRCVSQDVVQREVSMGKSHMVYHIP